VAPAQYVMPEGVALDSETANELAVQARVAGLSQEQFAQQVAGLSQFANLIQTRATQAAVAKATAELKADPEYGGANFDKTIADAKATVESIGGADLLAELDRTGLGNSPALIKAFAKL